MRRFLALQSRTLVATSAAVLLAGAAPVASAQTRIPDARWQPWIGCWQPTDGLTTSASEKSPLMCVVPSDSGGVDVVGLADGQVTSREHVVADGARRAATKGGCSGIDDAEFSSDARRVYLHSQYTCAANLHRATSGMLAMASSGDWLDIESVSVGLQNLKTAPASDVRVIRYHDAGIPKSLPSDIAQAVSNATLAIATARTAAAGTLTPADIIDASKHADSSVVQTWLAQRGGLPFTVDAPTLAKLADAGVPGSITDVLVALAYPKTFAVQAGGAYAQGALTPADSARVATRYLWGRGVPVDPFGLNYWDMYSLRYGEWGDPYGYGYGYGYSPYGYGYSPYGYGNGYGYMPGYYGAPVVVVRGAQQHGQVDKGRGYTRRGDETGAQPTPSRSPAGSSGGYSSGGSGHTSTGRTAKPRP